MSALAPVLLLACSGLSPSWTTKGTPTGGTSSTTPGPTGADPPPPPVLDPVAPYRNEDAFEVTGTAEEADEVEVTVVHASGSEVSAGPVVEGAFAVPVTVPRGETVTLRAVAVGPGGRSAAVDAPTEACDPPDDPDIEATWGAGYGDVCAAAHPWDVVLSDAGTSTTLTGNVHEEGDVDWWRITVLDEGGDAKRGIENFRVGIELDAPKGLFGFVVHRDGCLDEDRECPDAGPVDSYTFTFEDNEPDEQGNLPPDPRMCGDPPLDPCPDLSGDFLIGVERLDGGYDCTTYTLIVTAG